MATAAEMYEIISRSIVGAQELRDKVATSAALVFNDIARGNDEMDPPYDQSKDAHEARLHFLAETFVTDFTESFFQCTVAWARDMTQAEILNLSDADIKTAIEVTIDGMAISFEP